MELEDNGYFIKVLFRKFAFPTIMALLSSTISTFINSIMAGNYFGRGGLASLGICSPVFLVFASFGALVGGGAANVAAKHMSDNNIKEVNKLYSLALIIAIAGSIVISILGINFEENILNILGGQAQAGTISYYKAYIPFGIFIVLVFIPMNFARMDGKPKLGLFMFLSMAAVNVITNYILIIYFKMGIEAIALGTVAGSFAACITGFGSLKRKDSNISFSKLSIKDIREKISSILIAGSPMALNNLFSFIKTLTINSLFISLGASSQLGLVAIIWTLNSFASAIISGLGQGIVPLIGVFNEEKDNTSIRQVVKHSLFTGIIIFISLFMGIVIFWKQIFALFGLLDVGQNEQIAILFLGSSLIFAVVNVVISFYFIGARKIKFANIVTLARGGLFILPLVYILSTIYGTMGIWLSFLLAEICTLLLFFLFSYISYKKDDKLTFPLLMDKKWEDDKGYISFSVENKTEAIANAAEKVSEFCDENELSPKQTMFISLSIEELLGLIMSQSQEKSNSTRAVRILISHETIVIRIRYGGEKFNPIDYYKTNISEDIEKSIDIIGIKYIVNMAKNMDYLETFGINNLVIRL